MPELAIAVIVATLAWVCFGANHWPEDWKVICPDCESEKVVRDGDFLICDRCGHRWREYGEDN